MKKRSLLFCLGRFTCIYSLQIVVRPSFLMMTITSSMMMDFLIGWPCGCGGG